MEWACTDLVQVALYGRYQLGHLGFLDVFVVKANKHLPHSQHADHCLLPVGRPAPHHNRDHGLVDRFLGVLKLLPANFIPAEIRQQERYTLIDGGSKSSILCY